MPVTMHDREQGFEAKFAHDEELRFLVKARTDKLFARWAAQELGFKDEQSDAVVAAVMTVPDGPGHEERVLEYIGGLLKGREIGSTTDLYVVLHRCQQQARWQLVDNPSEHSDG